MDDVARGQVTASAARIYDEFFVPALFGPWAERTASHANIAQGQAVLDVACGTGVLTRSVHERAAPAGRVVGLDVNGDMLAVARARAPDIEWHEAPAEALPFGDATFDRVVSQFGLMFFEDRQAALAEMLRVLRPTGSAVVAVWDALQRTPGYADVVALLSKLFGDEVAEALRAPYVLGDPDQLRELFDKSGATDIEVERLEGTARFPSIADWIHTDVKGWTLGDMIDDDQYQALQAEAQTALARWQQADGSVRFPAPALLVHAKPR